MGTNKEIEEFLDEAKKPVQEKQGFDLKTLPKDIQDLRFLVENFIR